MSAFKRDATRVFDVLRGIDPESARRFLSGLESFTGWCEVALFEVSDHRLRGKPLKLREEALAARVLLERWSADGKALSLHAERHAPAPAPHAPREAAAGTSAPSASPAQPQRTTRGLALRTIIDAEFDDHRPKPRRRGRPAPDRDLDEQLELPGSRVLALPERTGR